VQQTGDQIHIKVKPQHSGEGKVGIGNKRGASTVIRIRPAKRLETSSLQAQQSSDANMANGTSEREGTPRMYKKTWIIHSANTEELEELEELRQLEEKVEMEEEKVEMEEDYYV
jgi:ribosomal 30S subunit maturation factor RimM